MPKPKKNKNDSLEELLLSIKLCCDRAKAHMKVREYEKALQGYNQVRWVPPSRVPIQKMVYCFPSTLTPIEPQESIIKRGVSTATPKVLSF